VYCPKELNATELDLAFAAQNLPAFAVRPAYELLIVQKWMTETTPLKETRRPPLSARLFFRARGRFCEVGRPGREARQTANRNDSIDLLNLSAWRISTFPPARTFADTAPQFVSAPTLMPDPPSSDIAICLAAIDRAAGLRQISSEAMRNLKAWLTNPPFETYRSTLIELVTKEQFAELDSLFWEVIPFGTGGRRGRMAAVGTATINARTIAESAFGLAAYLRKVKNAPGGRAVVACDTRHRSREFAQITATTLAASGLKVFLFAAPRATPELSFAVRHLSCDVGVMISASHNPPGDNGFKAYWSTGGQVLPPHDRGIVQCVAQAGEIPEVGFEAALSQGSVVMVGDEIDRDYVSAVVELGLSGARGAQAVFTPLHGVGETSVFRALSVAGFSRVEIFELQRTQDGSFPNVPLHLPNPELPSALQPACQRAEATSADLVLATDPDADRLGVAVRSVDGRCRPLTGNQVGVLLLDYILRKRLEAGRLSVDDFVCTTLVTSPMFRAVGEAAGVRVIDNLLVGFKYIAGTMEELGADKFVFGAEESLGYLAGDYCRDKDATIAALYVMELASELKSQGRTLGDDLDRLYLEHGYFAEGQRSFEHAGAQGRSRIDALLGELRNHPPADLAGVRLAQVRDYRDQVVRSVSDGKVSGQLQSAPGDLLFLDSIDGPRQFSIAMRPSGTEPKVKFYFFARARLTAGASLATVKAETDAQFGDLQEALLQWVRECVPPPASSNESATP
jgi:phosphoglucomutase